MKKDPRVDELVKIIGREHARVDVIEKAIRTRDDDGETWEPLRKSDKATARSLARSLKQVERVLNREDVSHLLDRMMFDIEGWLADLRLFRKDVEEIAALPLGQPKPSATRFTRKHEAVAAAAALLNAHGVRLSKSVFCRVAAVLYGDRTFKHEHFEHYCQQFLAGKRQTGLLAPGGNR